jgi:hypothetical protein
MYILLLNSTDICEITMFVVSLSFYTGCLKIREFRTHSVVGKDPVKLKKYLEKKFALPEEDIECSNEILGWEGVGNRQMLCFFKA